MSRVRGLQALERRTLLHRRRDIQRGLLPDGTKSIPGKNMYGRSRRPVWIAGCLFFHYRARIRSNRCSRVFDPAIVLFFAAHGVGCMDPVLGRDTGYRPAFYLPGTVALPQNDRVEAAPLALGRRPGP